jgi:hypothetical protein
LTISKATTHTKEKKRKMKMMEFHLRSDPPLFIVKRAKMITTKEKKMRITTKNQLMEHSFLKRLQRVA